MFTPDGSGGHTEVKLTASDGADVDVFGSAVAVNDDGVIVVGALGDDDKGGDLSGSVYVFTPDGSGGYTEAKLNKVQVPVNTKFGGTVAINNNGVIVVGAIEDDGNGNDSGAAYVYVPDGEGGYTEYRLTAPDAGVNGLFGSDVAINDAGLVTIGASNADSKGASYLFEPDASGAYGVIQNALELDEGTDFSPLTGDIEIVFADDGVATHSYQASVTGVSSTGSLGDLDADALLALLSVDRISKNPAAEQGTIHLEFEAGANVFDYLNTGDSVGLTYTVELDDGKDHITVQDVSVTINGKDDVGISGNDVLVGGSRNDTLNGLDGNDVLTGGNGNDTFVFNDLSSGTDTITDFEARDGSGETIRFDSEVFADFDAVVAAASDEGSSVVIKLDDDKSVTLNNVSKSELHADDFQFV
ncbi:Endo-1,3-1,4-beta-glycanase ExsH [Pseudovibrio sp. Ad46]|uniref:VCBS domain-containing protein n=1 Tax=unclassified Pseudovibrio TaxID=2627060 RepID=UPI0007AE8E08|nr:MULTISPECIES: VCBS domain-containing protein [unclassified Pseudovibrio]KZK86855.1 Endo-1,3-1,4-beta-glycanase ExsH [Pseudovibrio sp. Ad46]KZK92255.1 Endo-1,3-1,4-beta-glycanase ExsH [Pseudovibrio sp. Ad5]